VNPSLAMFLSFVIVSVFSFLSIAVWAGTRQQERKDFYRSETLKKLAESGSAAVIEYLREEEKQDERRRAVHRDRMIEGNRLAGMILLVVGGMLAVFLYYIVPNMPVYLMGLIPLGIGIVLLLTPMMTQRHRNTSEVPLQ
jgi:membrane protein implicated in regulation of membrane protease activity